MPNNLDVINSSDSDNAVSENTKYNDNFQSHGQDLWNGGKSKRKSEKVLKPGQSSRKCNCCNSRTLNWLFLANLTFIYCCKEFQFTHIYGVSPKNLMPFGARVGGLGTEFFLARPIPSMCHPWHPDWYFNNFSIFYPQQEVNAFHLLSLSFFFIPNLSISQNADHFKGGPTLW